MLSRQKLKEQFQFPFCSSHSCVPFAPATQLKLSLLLFWPTVSWPLPLPAVIQWIYCCQISIPLGQLQLCSAPLPLLTSPMFLLSEFIIIPHVAFGSPPWLYLWPSLHSASFLVKLNYMLSPKYAAFLMLFCLPTQFSSNHCHEILCILQYSTQVWSIPQSPQLWILYCLFGGRIQCLLSIFYIAGSAGQFSRTFLFSIHNIPAE